MAARRNPDVFLPVAAQDLELLLALSGGPLHGYAMMKAVEAQSRGRVRVELGSLYRMLHRLERDGLITAAASDEAAAPGRERRSYRTTALGNAVIAAELDRLRSVLKVAAGLRASEARS